MRGVDCYGNLCLYDMVLCYRATQDEVFVSGVKEIVESVLDGYNGSVIASGQTGNASRQTGNASFVY